MNIRFSSLPDILTAKEIASFLGVSYNLALKLIKYNMVYLKLGNTYRVTKENFEKFLCSNESIIAVLQ